jgi:hypothetical protein
MKKDTSCRGSALWAMKLLPKQTKKKKEKRHLLPRIGTMGHENVAHFLDLRVEKLTPIHLMHMDIRSLYMH